MADKKISQLDSTSSVNSDAVFPLSQTESGSLKTVKGTVDQIGDYIANTQDHSTLNTVSKKIIGAINEILSLIGTIEGTASGSVVSFNDGGNNIPVKSLVTEIVASQAGEGTPSPSNPRAISGFDNVTIAVAGKNIYSSSLVVGQRANASTGAIEAYSDGACTDYMIVRGGIDYIISGLINGLNDYISFYDQNKVYISRTSSGERTQRDFTTPDNACYCILTFIKVSGQTTDINTVLSLTPQLELGTTATTYEAYKGTAYTIALGSTVYGGTLDVVNGVLTVTHGIVDLGDLTWVYRSENAAFYNDTKITDCKVNPTTCLCSSYEFNANANNTSVASIASVLSDLQMAAFSNEVQSGRVVVKDSNYTDANAFKTAVTGQKLTYPLVTPVVIQLTPTEVVTLLGENNIYANSGDVEVEYFNEDASQFNDLIETIITSSSSDYHVYSTNEKVVGRWIDGKPIYEKTVDISQYSVLATDGVWTNLFALANVDKLVFAELHGNSPNMSQILRFQANSGYIQVAAKTNLQIGTLPEYFVTFKYTKSTI